MDRDADSHSEAALVNPTGTGGDAFQPGRSPTVSDEQSTATARLRDAVKEYSRGHSRRAESFNPRSSLNHLDESGATARHRNTNESV